MIPSCHGSKGGCDNGGGGGSGGGHSDDGGDNSDDADLDLDIGVPVAPNCRFGRIKPEKFFSFTQKIIFVEREQWILNCQLAFSGDEYGLFTNKYCIMFVL